MYSRGPRIRRLRGSRQTALHVVASVLNSIRPVLASQFQPPHVGRPCFGRLFRNPQSVGISPNVFRGGSMFDVPTVKGQDGSFLASVTVEGRLEKWNMCSWSYFVLSYLLGSKSNCTRQHQDRSSTEMRWGRACGLGFYRCVRTVASCFFFFAFARSSPFCAHRSRKDLGTTCVHTRMLCIRFGDGDETGRYTDMVNVYA